ncbi:energy transducer TonB [Pedobacter sp. L105]|uniref:energy transducer TonB n=1 Tax=Pedobacter sp. L105 TaxID=1641871 RepID=UPI00131D5340|nr:energy transducer TonB [Pedobacter sp. L105]
MNKYIYILSSILFLFTSASAQKQNVYYIKNNGQYVHQRDSADYIRIVLEKAKDSKLFTVKEFYTNGKRKSIGMSGTIDPPKYDGTYLSFYPNGNKKQVATYSKGHLVDSLYDYYPNGRLYTFFFFIEQPDHHLVRSLKSTNDSTGKAMVIDGNGPCILYSDDFKEIAEKGIVKNGWQDGIWTGKDKDAGVIYTQTYEIGKLISGESTDEKGKVVHYTREFIHPQFKGGMKELYKYLALHIIYPKNCKDNGIQGKAIMRFAVNEDGSLSDIRVVNDVHPDLAAEAIRVLKTAPSWTSGIKRGRKVRVYYSIPISFSLT